MLATTEVDVTEEQELKMLRVKCAGSLANNLCPDHRDKQAGKPCLACEIERLRKCASSVIDAFELLGRTSDTKGLLVARAKCENSMVALKEALGANVK